MAVLSGNRDMNLPHSGHEACTLPRGHRSLLKPVNMLISYFKYSIYLFASICFTYHERSYFSTLINMPRCFYILYFSLFYFRRRRIVKRHRRKRKKSKRAYNSRRKGKITKLSHRSYQQKLDTRNISGRIILTNTIAFAQVQQHPLL